VSVTRRMNLIDLLRSRITVVAKGLRRASPKRTNTQSK